jgi:pimeloyl-ACP methyl ester carboxylesterase
VAGLLRGREEPREDLTEYRDPQHRFRLRDALPNARLVVFRNCGHLPPAENPDRFVEVLAEFCN